MLLGCASALLLTGVVALLLIPLRAAHADMNDGRRAMVAARAELKHRHEDAAARDLDTAERALRRAATQSRRLPLRLARPVPLAGSPARAVASASRAGLEVVAAARDLLAASRTFPGRGSSGFDGHDLTPFHDAAVSSRAALARATTHLDTARALVDGPAHAALPPVASAGREMRRLVGDARRELDGAARGLTALAQLSDRNADYRLLLLAQDSMELRPTGGYIGSWGVIHFHHGTVALEEYKSFEELPEANPPLTPPRDLAVALNRAWDISNVNWWPNFPTTAKAAREMFKRQRGVDADGVVAITESVMARIVGVLGPFHVPGYAEPVVEQGFDKRVLWEVELKKPHDEPRKKFLALLSDQVFSRLFHMQPAEVPDVVKAIDKSVAAGDIRLWFADPQLQRQVDGTVLAGTLPKARGDFLMLVEANLSAGKANADLVRNATYRVHRDPDGHLIAHLSVQYRNDGDKTSINPYYNGFLRLYVPRGAKLISRDKRSFRIDGPAPDAPYDVFSHSVYVLPHGTALVDVEYELPDSVAPGGRYDLTWVRQAGTPRDSLNVFVNGRMHATDASAQSYALLASLPRHPVRAFLHNRWAFRKLGL